MCAEPQARWAVPGRLWFLDHLALHSCHAALIQHVTLMDKMKFGGWCGQRIFQLFLRDRKGGLFLDATSWASASAYVASSSFGVRGSAHFLADSVNAPSIDDFDADRDAGKRFPQFLLALLMEQCCVFEVFAPMFKDMHPVPVHLFPYFDIDCEFTRPGGADIAWDSLTWKRSDAPLHGIPVHAARLPEAHAQTVAIIVNAVRDVLNGAFPDQEHGAAVDPVNSALDARWRITVAFRAQKCSLHVVWTGYAVECTLPIQRSIEKVRSSGCMAARFIDIAVYRKNPDSGFQYRTALCLSKKKGQYLQGMHMPLASDWTVCIPSPGVSPNDRRMAAVGCAMDMLLQTTRRPLEKSLWETCVAEEAGRGMQGGVRLLKRPKRGSRNSPSMMSAKEAVGPLCKHVSPSWVVTRCGKGRRGGVWVRLKRPKGARCHMALQHGGNQDYANRVDADGGLWHHCFKNGKTQACRGRTMPCDDEARDRSVAVAWYKKGLAISC